MRSIDQRVEHRAEVADDARIIGVRALLPRLLQPALHRIAHLALGDVLVADLRQRPAAHAEADLADAEVGKIGNREAGEDGDQHERHDAGADLGFGNAAEEGEHRDPGAEWKEAGRFRGRAGAHQAAPLGRRQAQGRGNSWRLKKLVAGNWKMHGLSSDLEEIRAIAAAARDYPAVDVALCVPAILIERAARAVPGFAIGGQDVHHAEKGAHTGCTSALMLLDAGASLTIVGHCERRDAQRESDDEVKAKAEAALSVGLDVILCVGESLDVREGGGAVDAVMRAARRLAAATPLQRSGAGDRL